MENKIKAYKDKISDANFITSQTHSIDGYHYLVELKREQAEKALELGIKIGFSETEISNHRILGRRYEYLSINNMKDLNRFYEAFAKRKGFLDYLAIDPRYNELDETPSCLEFKEMIDDVINLEKENQKLNDINAAPIESTDNYANSNSIIHSDIKPSIPYHKRFTDEQIQKANEVSIVDYARQKGYTIKDIDSKTAKIEGNGGLFINKYTNKWNCFSNKMGGGVVQFATHMLGLSWVDAIKDLINEVGEFQYKQHQNINYIKEVLQSKDFSLPKKNTTYKHLFAYLIKTRRIDKDIMGEFVKQKSIYENNKGSCVFVGKDKDNISRYASVRSTSTNKDAFKGEALGSDKRFGFNRPGNSDKLVIFESPIDLLSYITMYKMAGLEDRIKDYHLLSLGGVSDVALKQYLKDHPKIKEIMSALDSDEAGNKASEEIKQKYGKDYKVNRLNITNGKDLNEVLINKYNEIELQEKVSNQIPDYQMET